MQKAAISSIMSIKKPIPLRYQKVHAYKMYFTSTYVHAVYVYDDALVHFF